MERYESGSRSRKYTLYTVPVYMCRNMSEQKIKINSLISLSLIFLKFSFNIYIFFLFLILGMTMSIIFVITHTVKI